MKITVIAFEIAKEDADKTMMVCHRLMSKFAYVIHIPASEKGFVLPFPSNVLASTSEKETPTLMEENLRIICKDLGIKLIKCVAFTSNTEEAIGLPGS